MSFRLSCRPYARSNYPDYLWLIYVETSKNGHKQKLKIDYGQKMLSYAPVNIMYITVLSNILSYIAHLTKNFTNLLVGFKK